MIESQSQEADRDPPAPSSDGPRRTQAQLASAQSVFHRDYLHLAPLTRDVIAFLTETSGRVVDFGCGQMPYRAFAPAAVSEYVGVDHDPANDQATIICPIENTPLDDATFDYVLSTQVLEHVPDPQLVLQEMARVLKPGGDALVTVPQAWELHEEPHDYYRYTPFGLTVLAERCGFAVERVSRQGTDWSLLGLKLNRRISRIPVVRRGAKLVYPITNYLCSKLDDMEGKDIINFAMVLRKQP